MPILHLKPQRIRYSQAPASAREYTQKMDTEYTWMAKGYDLFMHALPQLKKWIRSVIPLTRDPRIPEISLGRAGSAHLLIAITGS